MIFDALAPLWGITKGHPDVRVAILDGPVISTGAELASAQLVISPDITDLDPNHASVQHGTEVASIIFARHSERMRGVAPGVTGLVLPIFDTDGDRLVPATQEKLGERIVEAVVELDANIINISAGEFAHHLNIAHPLAKALRLAETRGVLVIAAAGNQGCHCTNVPAAWPSVLAVGSHNTSGDPSVFSNFGGHYRSNGLLAPGENLSCLSTSGDVVLRSGTSYASAFVTGVAALVQSARISRNEGVSLSGAELKESLLRTSDLCDPAVENSCDRFLYGRLNIRTLAIEVLTMTNSEKHSDSPQQDVTDGTQCVVPSSSSPGTEDRHTDTLYQSETHVGSHATGNNISVASSIQDNHMSTDVAPPPSNIGNDNNEMHGSGVLPAGCACGNGTPPEIAYALGTIQHAFAGQAAMDAAQQYMSLMDPPGKPTNSADVIRFIRGEPKSKGSKQEPDDHGKWEGGIEYARMFVWVLAQDETPLYALVPMPGSNPDRFYEKVVQVFEGQCDPKLLVERCSVPGFVKGEISISDGQLVLRTLHTETIGLFSWNTAQLVNAVASDNAEKKEEIRSFLDRLYYELSNAGITPSERALNYSGTNAFHIERVFEKVHKMADFELDQIQVEKSRLCRPHADCWDVKLIFFNPKRRTEEARKVYRFTVDVSSVLPVTVGPVRSWAMF